MLLPQKPPRWLPHRLAHHRAERAGAVAQLSGDLANALTGRQDASGLAGAMLMRGSTTLSREQIDQRFEALKTQANVSGNLQGAGISMQTRRAQLPEALALAAGALIAGERRTAGRRRAAGDPLAP